MFLLQVLGTLTIQIVGDPVRALFADNAPPAAVIQQVRADYSLDPSAPAQVSRSEPSPVFWHLLVLPASFIVITVFAFIRLGDVLRDALDPRTR